MENKNTKTNASVEADSISAPNGISTRHKPYVCIKNATSGITLIALVITIIILLILAGIVLNLTIGENGIITKAQQAGINYDEAGAREKLELALLDLQAEKVVNSAYNDSTHIDNYLTKKQMTVNGNIVTVGKWQFEIDRSVPKIVSSLGKGDEIITEQKANLTAGNMTDGKIMLKIEVALPNDTIQGIEIYDETNSKIKMINVPTGIKQIQKEQEIYVEFMEEKSYYAKINNTIQTNTVSVQKNENVINTAKDLQNLSTRVNSGETFEGKTITQMQDIDLSTVCGSGIGNWEAIGYASTNSYWFNGTYDGNGKSVTNLYINNTEDKTVGLFGFLGYKGIVKNVTVYGEVMQKANSGNNRATGGIVGRNEGTIENCVNYSNVISTNTSVGGIVGFHLNIVRNCENYGGINGQSFVGGIIGQIMGGSLSSNNNSDLPNIIVDNCTNNGEVVASSSIAGGIVGVSDADITSCKNIGTVTSNGNPSNQVTTQGTGGIVGRISGTVSKCDNTGAISSSGFFVGGIVGFGETGTRVEKSYNYNGNIQTGQNGAGGIIGRGDGVTIENCYNHLSSNEYHIKAQNDNAGGIVGVVGLTNTIKNCYSIGNNIQAISATSNVPNYYAGAIVGVTSNGSSTQCINVYYEDTNLLQATSKDYLGINGTMKPKSTEDFKKSKTDTSSVAYLLNGNASDGIWEQDGNVNGGYPYLKENRP